MKPQERERIIKGIATHRGSDGRLRTGIYGAEVCQLCGEIGAFSGFASAVGSHFSMREFVAASHRHPGDFHTYSELLDGRDHRFCELCRESVRRDVAQKFGHYWLCAGCAADWLDKHGDDPADALNVLARCRYVALRSDDEVRAWAEVLALP